MNFRYFLLRYIRTPLGNILYFLGFQPTKIEYLSIYGYVKYKIKSKRNNQILYSFRFPTKYKI